MTDQEIIKAIAFTSRYIKELFPLDCMVSVTDQGSFIAYYPGDKIDVKAQVNAPVPNDDIIHHVISTGKKMVATVPKEAYGFPFKGICLPVKNENGKVIGSFNVGIDLSTQSELTEMAEQLASSFEQISSSSEELASSAQELNSFQSQLLTISNIAREKLDRTDEILKLVKDVATQTNLLGLNAAIEAARAGENGKGFSVVAEEIRKLSDRTSKSTKEVTEILREISQQIKQLSENISRTEIIGSNLASASEEISATIQSNIAFSDKLVSLSKML